VALFFSFLELLCFAGVAFGYGFVQFIWEQEAVFWDDKCYNEAEHGDVCTAKDDNGFWICGDDSIAYKVENACEAQGIEHSSIFTWFLLTSNLASLVLDPIHKYFGTFALRIILCCLSSGGILCLMLYPTNHMLIWPGWQLIGLPALMYVILNIKEICAIFPAKRSMMISLINGVFGASAGIFILFKLIYVNTNIELSDMFLVYLFLSISIWVKTFFFAPFKFAELNTLGTYNVLADSAIGSCFGFRDSSTGINQSDKEDPVSRATVQSTMSGVSKYGADAPEPPIEFEDGEEPDSLWKHLFSPKLCIYVIFYTCLTTRINSFPSWAYPWFQWSESVKPEEDRQISLLMDIYGFAYFIAFVIAPLPGIIIKFVQDKVGKMVLGEHHSLTFFFVLSVILSTVMSIQMCFQGSTANAIILTILVSSFRTLFFISRGIFLYMQFPREYFGTLYAVSLVPAAACQYIIQPLFEITLNGDDIADADFVPVAIGFAVMSAVSIYMPLYNHFVLINQLPPEEGAEEERRQTIMSRHTMMSQKSFVPAVDAFRVSTTFAADFQEGELDLPTPDLTRRSKKYTYAKDTPEDTAEDGTDL